MQLYGTIHHFSKEVKLLIAFFLLTLSIGFFGGITFVKETTETNPTGIEERYLGNEGNEQAVKMQFKKSEGEVLTLVHNHILSLSVIFFILSVLIATTSIPKKLQLFLMIEPFISILCTFGGIYFLWKEILWMKYLIMISGFLMTLTFATSVVILLWQLFQKNGDIDSRTF